MEYDDSRYLEWCKELQALVDEYLDTEGNSIDSLREDVEVAIENSDTAVE